MHLNALFISLAISLILPAVALPQHNKPYFKWLIKRELKIRYKDQTCQKAVKSRVFVKSPAVGNCYRTVENKIKSNQKVLKLKTVCI